MTGLFVSATLVAIAGGVYYYRRQKFDPRNYKQNSGKNGIETAGDEFSEVRFLTTEEQLDFSMQTPVVASEK